MEEINTEVNKTNTFLSHMFSFDNDTKNELMNIGQYAILSIVPLVALVKLIDGLVANFDPTKGNIELVGEILVHLTLLIIAVFLVGISLFEEKVNSKKVLAMVLFLIGIYFMFSS